MRPAEVPVVVYRFGRFALDPASFRLRRDGTDVPLTPKALEILVLLVRERRRGLAKQELFDAVWPDTAVTENTLTQRIKEIREALHDSSHEPVYIRTIQRVGYQFIAEVVEDHAAALERQSATAASTDDSTRGEPADDPEGRRAAGSSDRAPLATTLRLQSRWRRNALVGGAGLLLLAAAGVWVSRPGRGAADLNPARAGRVMLAVLPFENVSGDPEQDYFSDGLTEELITELGRRDHRQLGVIARTSSMATKGTTESTQVIAGKLGVDYVLEGSVRREADRVRVAAQLIRASDQTHLWAERYDRDVSSMLELQSELAAAIATELRMRLPVPAPAAVDRPRRVHPEAYQAYLRGRFFLNRRTGTAVQKGVEHFQQAVALDPSYARGYAGLADAYELAASYAGVMPRASITLAMAAARKALDLEPGLSEPHTSLGLIHGSYTWEWVESELAFKRAIALNASDALAHKGYSELLSFLGRHDDAITAAKRAVTLDPLSLIMQANLGVTYYRARRYDEAARQMHDTLDLDPHYMLGHFNLGMILAASGSYDEAARAFQRAQEYAPDFADAVALLGYTYGRLGRTAEARAIVAELRRRQENEYASPYPRAAIHVALGEWPQALADLEQAYDDRSWLVAMLKVDPMFDPLRGHQRFEQLVRRLNFPDPH